MSRTARAALSRVCNTLHKPHWPNPFFPWRSKTTSATYAVWGSTLNVHLSHLECIHSALGKLSLPNSLFQETAKSNEDVDRCKAQGQAVPLTLMHISTCSAVFTEPLSSGMCVTDLSVQCKPQEDQSLWGSVCYSPRVFPVGWPGWPSHSSDVLIFTTPELESPCPTFLKRWVLEIKLKVPLPARQALHTVRNVIFCCYQKRGRNRSER